MLKCTNLECRVDKDADGRITEDEIKEVWNHKFYFLVSSIDKTNFFQYVILSPTKLDYSRCLIMFSLFRLFALVPLQTNSQTYRSRQRNMLL